MIEHVLLDQIQRLTPANDSASVSDPEVYMVHKATGAYYQKAYEGYKYNIYSQVQDAVIGSTVPVSLNTEIIDHKAVRSSLSSQTAAYTQESAYEFDFLAEDDVSNIWACGAEAGGFGLWKRAASTGLWTLELADTTNTKLFQIYETAGSNLPTLYWKDSSANYFKLVGDNIIVSANPLPGGTHITVDRANYQTDRQDMALILNASDNFPTIVGNSSSDSYPTSMGIPYYNIGGNTSNTYGTSGGLAVRFNGKVNNMQIPNNKIEVLVKTVDSRFNFNDFYLQLSGTRKLTHGKYLFNWSIKERTGALTSVYTGKGITVLLEVDIDGATQPDAWNYRLIKLNETNAGGYNDTAIVNMPILMFGIQNGLNDIELHYAAVFNTSYYNVNTDWGDTTAYVNATAGWYRQNATLDFDMWS